MNCHPVNSSSRMLFPLSQCCRLGRVGTCCSPAPSVPGALLRGRPRCGAAGTSAPRQRRGTPAPTATCWQPLNWQPGGVTPVLQLGETPAFLSPICLTARGATFLIICRGSLLAASFLSAPLPSCKQVRASYLPPSVSGLERTSPHSPPPRLLSVAQATGSCPKNQSNWDWWTFPSPP